MGEKLWNGEGLPAVGEFCEFKGRSGWRKVQISYVGPQVLSAIYIDDDKETQEMAVFHTHKDSQALIKAIKR